MSTILRASHVLAVNDLNVSTRFYVDKLGFKVLNEYPGWAFLGRESFVVMLGECTESEPASAIGDHSYIAYVYVVDVSALYDEFSNANVEFVKKLTSESWGMKEFGIRTVDGHRIMFGEDISE